MQSRQPITVSTPIHLEWVLSPRSTALTCRTFRRAGSPTISSPTRRRSTMPTAISCEISPMSRKTQASASSTIPSSRSHHRARRSWKYGGNSANLGRITEYDYKGMSDITTTFSQNLVIVDLRGSDGSALLECGGTYCRTRISRLTAKLVAPLSGIDHCGELWCEGPTPKILPFPAGFVCGPDRAPGDGLRSSRAVGRQAVVGGAVDTGPVGHGRRREGAAGGGPGSAGLSQRDRRR